MDVTEADEGVAEGVERKPTSLPLLTPGAVFHHELHHKDQERAEWLLLLPLPLTVPPLLPSPTFAVVWEEKTSRQTVHSTAVEPDTATSHNATVRQRRRTVPSERPCAGTAPRASIAMLRMMLYSSAISPSCALTFNGPAPRCGMLRPSFRQYMSGWTSCR